MGALYFTQRAAHRLEYEPDETTEHKNEYLDKLGQHQLNNWKTKRSHNALRSGHGFSQVTNQF